MLLIVKLSKQQFIVRKKKHAKWAFELLRDREGDRRDGARRKSRSRSRDRRRRDSDDDRDREEPKKKKMKEDGTLEIESISGTETLEISS
ncbi:hypothetical protein F2Q68_00028213 [Brassica cretica]|uniref:Uncharacterized protein n=1 Tax=Brassica cretica TaxID=69181 RepID=A0A8S9IEY3_BRACR|nr:hypothetical protein F2Q68_00028213 [Brassica cretica]